MSNFKSFLYFEDVLNCNLHPGFQNLFGSLETSDAASQESDGDSLCFMRIRFHALVEMKAIIALNIGLIIRRLWVFQNSTAVIILE